MSSIFETVAHHWKGGGFGMYPIAICLVFAVAVIIDRIQVLFFSASVDKEQFLRGLKTNIFNGDLDKAISYTAGQKATPLKMSTGCLSEVSIIHQNGNKVSTSATASAE